MPRKFTTIIKCDDMAQRLKGLEHLLDRSCYIFFGLGFDVTSQQYLSDAFDHGDNEAILSIDRITFSVPHFNFILYMSPPVSG